jgi:uncharacterized protein
VRADRNLPRVFLGALLAAMLGLGAATPVAAEDLYRSQTLITGQGETNRLIGFAVCLEQVLIKVSGAVSLTGDPRLEPYKKTAKEFVRAYEYLDEKLGKPKNDEQGTRDRSFFLIVDFDEKRVDDTLAALGLKPWRGHRPVLGLFVEVNPGARTYIVTSDSPQTDLHRASLRNAADRRGMQIALPALAMTAKLPPGGLAAASALAPLAAEQGGEVVVVAHLAWDDQAFAWINDWRLDWQGRPYRWQFRAGTFDEAYRRGIGNVAEVLSGAKGADTGKPQ